MTAPMYKLLDPSKYPSRLGQPWDDEETLRLLTSIQKKKAIDEIAKEHDRTVGGIRCQIQRLAADYHFNDQRPIEEIQKYTGLSVQEIQTIIRKKQKVPIKKNSDAVPESPSLKEILAVVKDIQYKLNLLIEKVA
jgi:hypothetical protein